jgi:membrane protein YdbS with pleckstrin-like domain
MANDWYFMENGQVQGPVSASHLQQLAGLGRITRTTQVTKGSAGPWVEASNVKGLSFATGPVQPPPPPSPVAVTPKPQPSAYSPQVAQSQEQLLWTGRPSQIVNLGSFILCGLLFWLVIPIFIALWNWLTIRCMTYELTNQRFRISRGVLSRRTDELELYRVKDTSLVQPFWLRIFSLANIVMITSDMSTPSVSIKGIPFDNAKQLRETLRSHVEQLRERKRVREIDVI